jgi:hypothetical protein
MAAQFPLRCLWIPLSKGAGLKHDCQLKQDCELLASVFKQCRTQGRSEFSASVSQQVLTTQTGLLVGIGVRTATTKVLSRLGLPPNSPPNARCAILPHTTKRSRWRPRISLRNSGIDKGVAVSCPCEYVLMRLNLSNCPARKRGRVHSHCSKAVLSSSCCPHLNELPLA